MAVLSLRTGPGIAAGLATQNVKALTLAIGGATIGANALAVTGLVNFGSAGSAVAPTLSVGNATTGLYSVSTTGIGITVNGALKFDFGITNGGTTVGSSTLVQGNITANSGLTVGAVTGNSVIAHAAATRLLLGTDGQLQFTNAAASNSVTITAGAANLATFNGGITLGGPLKLSNAYAVGAVVPTGTLTLYDGTGTAYRVPCLV